MNYIKLLIFVVSTTLSQFSISNTTQDTVDKIMEVSAYDSNIAQAAIIYGSLDIKYYELVDEWNAKYAHTDSSIVDYKTVRSFVSKAEIGHGRAERYLYLTVNLKEFHDEALYISESYRLLVNRGNTYLDNIKEDNDFRRDITKAMNSTLLLYDEDIIATLDRMKGMIKNDIKTNIIKE